jgi:hypothetical protein
LWEQNVVDLVDDNISTAQGVTMNPPTLQRDLIRGNENESEGPSLRSVVRKSALLNATIVLTSFPVLVYAGGPQAVVPTLKIMVGISLLIWIATYTLFSFVSLARIFWAPVSSGKRSNRPHREKETGVADRWLDGSV